MSKCPHCGGQVRLAPVERQPGRVFEFAPPTDRFEQVATADLERMRPPASTWTERPVRNPSKWDFGIPALFALGTAVVVGVPATAGALVIEAAKPLLLGPALGWFAGGAVWFWRIGAFERLMVAAEERIGLDINQDGRVGEPEPRPQPVEVWQRTRQSPQRELIERYELPVDYDKMRQFARYILDGGNLSRDAVTGVTDVTQGEYNELLRELERRGMVGRVGNQRELLASGRSLLGKFV